MVVRGIQTGNSLKVKISINNIVLDAIIDTGASASFCSSKAFEKMTKKPEIIRSKIINMAGINQTFTADYRGPFRIAIGHLLLFKNLYVGPIQDDFLLGLDLLYELKASINVGEGTFHCRNYPVPIKKFKFPETTNYARLSEDVNIGSFSESIAKINCEEGKIYPYFYLDPDYSLPVMIASAVYGRSRHNVVCLINNTNSPITLNKNTKIGQIVPINEEDIFDHDISVKNMSVSNNKLPERLVPLLNNVHPSLTSEEREQLQDLLCNYQDVFAVDEYDIGNFTGISHKIELKDTLPVKLNMRKTPLHLVDEEETLIKKLLKAGIIQPSTSSYASAPVMLRKKNGSLRYCLDYRLLNKKTIKDTYPLPLLSDCIESLVGNLWFSKLDCNNAYHQINVHPESRDKTAFRTRLGLFEYNKLPFGLCNAVSTYSRAIDLVLRGLNWKTVLAFLDDICVLGKSVSDHLNNLQEVFERFRYHGMKFKPTKCELFKKTMEFLGRQVSPNGVTITNHAIEVIRNWKKPTNVKQLQSFLGFCNFHRNFIKNYSEIAEPMFRLLKKKQQFSWGPEQNKSFQTLCEALISPAVLANPTRSGRMHLDCDSSSVAIGAELWQYQDGVKRVISYGSFALSKAQLSYCVTRLELLSVVRFCIYFKAALLSQEFTVTTDHFALKWLYNFKNLEGQLARWVEVLSQFNMTIEHRPGKHHINADALSRRPNDDPCLIVKDPKMLPCGGCKHCMKVHNKWADFEDQVNDIVNLADNVKKGSITNSCDAKSSDTNALVKINRVRIINDGDEEIDILGFSSDEIKAHQQKDSHLSFLFDFLNSGIEPTEQELKLSHPAQQFYFLNKNLFSLHDGIIFQTIGVQNKLLLIPQSLKNEVLYLCHDIPSSGHLGIAKTKHRVNLNYTWFKKSKDISNYVLSCKLCNTSKSANRPSRHPRVIDHAGYPLQKVHMDHLGPLTVSNDGNVYILVIVDQFTKWVECIPLRDLTAENTAKSAVNYFFSRFGYPVQIVTDQGSTFESQLFQEMCKLLRIRKSRTSGYRPSANGQAEIKNRVLMAAVRCFVNKNQRDWDIYIPLIASALRSAVNRHTGYTPNELMLGRQLNTPSDLVFPDSRLTSASPNQYIVALRKNMELAHDLARDYLKVQLKVTKKYNDINNKSIKYSEGDVIYFLDRAPKSKLKPKWLGPGIVIKVYSPQTLQIQLKNNPKLKVVSHDYLKPCLDRKIPSWILKTQKSILNKEPRTSCICDKPDDGTFMVQCNNCQEWYHIRCVNISKTKAKKLEEFICPNCTSQSQQHGEEVSSFKEWEIEERIQGRQCRHGGREFQPCREREEQEVLN